MLLDHVSDLAAEFDHGPLRDVLRVAFDSAGRGLDQAVDHPQGGRPAMASAV
jgi:hypothetical protein